MKKSKKTFLLILLVCLAPVVFSYLFFFFFRPSSFTNHGILLSPPADIKNASTQAFWLEPNTKGKWILLTHTANTCESTCEHTLFYLNQLKKATGDESHRVAALGLLPTSEQKNMQARIALTDVVPIYFSVPQMDQLNAFFTHIRPQNTSPERFQFKEDLLDIWIVDPMGNVVFYYPPGADPNKIKKDLNKLLKASRIG